ncbi:hypothetical protein EDB83DRAFT_1915746 [Lactarius deliciosus]|nr:hypothetical protein EDB83DRAFT_1915746 [Lactarius deliciosus]
MGGVYRLLPSNNCVEILEPRHRRGLPSGPSIPHHMQAHHRHPAAQKPRPPRRQAVVRRKTNATYKSPLPPPPLTAATTRMMSARTMATTLDVDGADDINTGDTRPTTTMATNTQLTTSWASAQCIEISFFIFLFCFILFLTDSHPVSLAHLIPPLPLRQSTTATPPRRNTCTDATP